MAWLKNGFNFGGTLNVAGYAQYGLLLAIALAVVTWILGTILVFAEPTLGVLVYVVGYILAGWVVLAAQARRLRDARISLFALLINFVPFGSIIMLIICLVASSKSEKTEAWPHS